MRRGVVPPRAVRAGLRELGAQLRRDRVERRRTCRARVPLDQDAGKGFLHGLVRVTSVDAVSGEKHNSFLRPNRSRLQDAVD